MNEHPSYVVYKNLPLFLKSRGLAAPTGDFELGRNKYIADLEFVGYIRIDAESGGGITTILILAQQSKYAKHGPDLRKLLKTLDTEDGSRMREVVVIAPEVVFEKKGKKNMFDVIAEFRAAKTIEYNMYPYSIFSHNLLDVAIVPKHEVLSTAEMELVLSQMRLTGRDLKTMLVTDPAAVWLGGRAGQLVRTTSPSETAGEAIDYWMLR